MIGSMQFVFFKKVWKRKLKACSLVALSRLKFVHSKEPLTKSKSVFKVLLKNLKVNCLTTELNKISSTINVLQRIS